MVAADIHRFKDPKVMDYLRVSYIHIYLQNSGINPLNVNDVTCMLSRIIVVIRDIVRDPKEYQTA